MLQTDCLAADLHQSLLPDHPQLDEFFQSGPRIELRKPIQAHILPGVFYEEFVAAFTFPDASPLLWLPLFVGPQKGSSEYGHMKPYPFR